MVSVESTTIKGTKTGNRIHGSDRQNETTLFSYIFSHKKNFDALSCVET